MSCCREAQRIVADMKARGLGREARRLAEVLAAEPWSDKPEGWDKGSMTKFWNSLTGDRKHKITQCIKKMQGKVQDPGAFCGSLASKVGYR